MFINGLVTLFVSYITNTFHGDKKKICWFICGNALTVFILCSTPDQCNASNFVVVRVGVVPFLAYS